MLNIRYNKTVFYMLLLFLITTIPFNAENAEPAKKQILLIHYEQENSKKDFREGEVMVSPILIDNFGQGNTIGLIHNAVRRIYAAGFFHRRQ